VRNKLETRKEHTDLRALVAVHVQTRHAGQHASSTGWFRKAFVRDIVSFGEEPKHPIKSAQLKPEENWKKISQQLTLRP